ncbi:hypothetical protein ARMSODRAFT_1042775 [Armillaria solidipes]|uniref:Uncharacterized protein n=1 Tax=Armillaria solidipes TaxID=1076256 RepID=A0A2H3CK30_9AGAR|nr:hypothetical protein ARMSODRAFT_1042775 [Armillaria solidipes]
MYRFSHPRLQTGGVNKGNARRPALDFRLLLASSLAARAELGPLTGEDLPKFPYTESNLVSNGIKHPLGRVGKNGNLPLEVSAALSGQWALNDQSVTFTKENYRLYLILMTCGDKGDDRSHGYASNYLFTINLSKQFKKRNLKLLQQSHLSMPTLPWPVVTRPDQCEKTVREIPCLIRPSEIIFTVTPDSAPAIAMMIVFASGSPQNARVPQIGT